MSFRDLPVFRDLRAFLNYLDTSARMIRITAPVSTVHEMTEVHRRVLAQRGPALLFENARVASGAAAPMPALVNLFGSTERVAWGLGMHRERIPALGELLVKLRQPEPIDGLKGLWESWPLIKAALSAMPSFVGRPAVQEEVHLGRDVDLSRLPVQTCWPGEPAPLITWPLVITRPPTSDCISSYNTGVYRMQVLARDRAVVRWLAHRGGAAHHRLWAAAGREMPIAVAIGADPATMLSAVLPLPEGMSELRFSGLLRGERPRLARCVTQPLTVPADAEIVIEGAVSPNDTAPEGPYGDHTGYYNAVENFPVMRITAITSRHAPIYVSTYTGRPPDEPSIIGEALNELFVPILRSQIPEVVDCFLPSDACSYRMAIISIHKRYPGQARRVMMALWGMMVQFSYTKIVVIVDDDIDVRNHRDVLWALSTRMDPSRDLVVLDRTPIDYLDFSSPLNGLGGKLGIDATNKLGAETSREWGRPLAMDPAIMERVDRMWPRLGLDSAQVPAKGGGR
ncbi:MAG: UbiD family decarboxylase [Hyphomicrobiaceae bacterium]